MYLDNVTELALPYTRFYRLAEHFRPGMRRMLVLGGGGYSFPKYALAHYPDVEIDVVELDPGITALAKSHFGLVENARLNIVEEDARTFLQKSGSKYDVILCDVFTSHYSIPFHLTTVEAIALMRSALAPNGVVLVNLLAAPEGDSGRFYRALHATFRTAFSSVQTFAVADPADRQRWQNLILAAGSFPPPADTGNPEIRAMLAQALPEPPANMPPLTDEFAPVDRYISELSPGPKAH